MSSVNTKQSKRQVLKEQAEPKAGGPVPKKEKEDENGLIRAPGGKKNSQDASKQAVAKAGKRQLADEKKKGNLHKGKKKKEKRDRAKPKARKFGFFANLFAEMGIGTNVVQLTDPYALEAAQALDLRPYHLRILQAKFNRIDIDGSGSIDVTEFLDSVGERRSPFTDKLFALIDMDGSGAIEFDEYVRVLATYCMFTKDEILRFCFECYDVDGSGTIDEKEFVELCKTVNNASPAYPANFKKALEEFDVNEDGLIDYAEFLELDRRYPLILFPAFRLQDMMQKNSLGESTWLRIIENYNRMKKIEEYKAQHGGRLPPDPPLRALGKIFMPCFFRERVHVKLGAEMEARHRKK